MLAGKNQHPQEVQVGKEPRRRNIRFEPLRTQGRHALEIAGFQGLIQARLWELEITFESVFQQLTIIRARDLFGYAGSQAFPHWPIPKTGRITRARFALYFADCPEPGTLELCAPDLLIYPQDKHADLVKRWLDRSQFLNSADTDDKPTHPYLCKTPGAASKNFPA